MKTVKHATPETLRPRPRPNRREAGFSLAELTVAMAVSLFLMAAAAALLSSSFNVRAREDRRADATADVQRALNIMSREIGGAGYRLPAGLIGVAPNGLITGDSNNQSVRFVTNLNSVGAGADADVSDAEEDVKYLMYVDDAQGRRYVVRHDRNRASNRTTVLANRIDSFVVRYYDEKVTYTASNCDITNVRNVAGTAEAEVNPALAKYLVFSVCVTLPPVGRPGTLGHQPAQVSQLTSDVVLRNSISY